MLSDEDARRRYDLGGGGSGNGGPGNGGPGSGGGWSRGPGGSPGNGQPFGDFQHRSPEDIFKEFFGTSNPFEKMFEEHFGGASPFDEMFGGKSKAGRTAGGRPGRAKNAGASPDLADMMKGFGGNMFGGGGGDTMKGFGGMFGGSSGGFSTSFTSTTTTVGPDGRRVTKIVSRGPDGVEKTSTSTDGEAASALGSGYSKKKDRRRRPPRKQIPDF